MPPIRFSHVKYIGVIFRNHMYPVLMMCCEGVGGGGGGKDLQMSNICFFKSRGFEERLGSLILLQLLQLKSSLSSFIPLFRSCQSTVVVRLPAHSFNTEFHQSIKFGLIIGQNLINWGTLL